MPGKRGTGPKRPPLEPLNTAAAQSQNPVCRLSDAEREQLEATRAPDGSSITEVMSEIKPWLFLGGLADALDSDFLHAKSVTHVLNVAKECESGEDGDKYLKLELIDHSDEDIKKRFKEAFDFINEAKEQGEKVLIHCQRGISRSATIAIAYLMDSDRLSLNQAFDFVRRRRPIINPNLGFVLALESYHKKLFPSQGAQSPQAPLHGLQSPQVPSQRRQSRNPNLKPVLSLQRRECEVLAKQEPQAEQGGHIDSKRVSPLLPTPTTQAAQDLSAFLPVRDFNGGCEKGKYPRESREVPPASKHKELSEQERKEEDKKVTADQWVDIYERNKFPW